MVVAGVEVFRLGDALGFGITGGPLHHRAAGIRVRGAIEEVVGRRLLGVRVLAARVGQMAGVGGRQHRHLVVGDEADQRLGVAGAPALQRDHAFALPALVVGDCVRDLVGVVDCFHVDRRARNPAVGVDEVDRVAHARSVILADESGRAGVIDQLADEHLVLCQRRECGAREEAAHGHNSPFHVVSPKGRSTGVPGRFAAASAGSQLSIAPSGLTSPNANVAPNNGRRRRRAPRCRRQGRESDSRALGDGRLPPDQVAAALLPRPGLDLRRSRVATRDGRS